MLLGDVQLPLLTFLCCREFWGYGGENHRAHGMASGATGDHLVTGGGIVEVML